MNPALLSVAIAALWASAAQAEITGARYADPTERYAHGVLGDAIEHGTLVLERKDAAPLRIVLPETRVFEDTAPRVVDLDGDGAQEVVVVESDADLGARLAVYDETGLRMATPHIGQSFRWLAPAAIADLDGDGHVEIAFVDRPHLIKRLLILRVNDDQLDLVAELRGLTNHRIGDREIFGGLRDCGDGPEIVLASADWQHLAAVRFNGLAVSAREIAPLHATADFKTALDCKL